MATWHQFTRLHNDAMRVAQQVNESQAPLKYVTYGPDYLRQKSCDIGNRGNCSVYSSLDVIKEPRGGMLTDKRTINRQTTQTTLKRMHVNNPDKAMGNLYAPSGGPENNPIDMIFTGQPLSNHQIDAYAQLFTPQQFSKPCDVDPVGNYVNNHLDRAVDTSMVQESMSGRILGHDELMRSTRVERRNQWNKSNQWDTSCNKF